MPVRSWKDLLADAGDGGGTFDPLPEGDYDLKVVEATTKQSSSGNTMWTAKCAVQGGPHNGRFVWNNFVLSMSNPTALGFFFRNMNCLGLNAAYFATDPADHQVADALVNREFRGQIILKTWQGQERNEIKNFFPKAGTKPGGPAGPTAAPTYAAPPPIAQATPPAPPAAAPSPPPVQQAPAPAPVAEKPAEQVQAAPVAPPAPPAAPAPEAAVAAPPAPAPEPVMSGAGAPPPPPFS